MNQAELFSGENLKSVGIERVISHNPDWSDLVLDQIQLLARSVDTFTAEDLRKQCALVGIPHPKHHNGWGAVMSRASKAGIIQQVGYCKNHLASAHARIVGIWKLV